MINIDQEDRDIGNESPGNDIEEKFVNAVVEMVADALDVNYREKRNFKALLKSNVRDQIVHRGGLLEQYLHSCLRKIIDKFELKFDLKEVNIG